MSLSITIVGNVNCGDYQRAKSLAEFLKKSSKDNFEVRGFFETDFDRIRATVQSYISHSEGVLIIMEEEGKDKIVQFGVRTFEGWAGINYAFSPDDWQCGDFEANLMVNAKRDLRGLMNPERSYVWVNFVARDNDYSGPVLIEFFDDICPKSCAFMKKKLSELAVTRSVKDGWIQLGSNSRATEEEGIVRESYAVRHDNAGIVGLCSSGAEHELYGKEFYITTRALEHLDGRGVAIGRVVEGLELIDKISEIETISFSNQKPKIDVLMLAVDVSVEDISEVIVEENSKNLEEVDTDVESIARSILQVVMENVVVVG